MQQTAYIFFVLLLLAYSIYLSLRMIDVLLSA